ncbi:MAG: C-type lectin domain-containing protein [Flavobacteriales bacterium]|nr:C-type lectin domain-containing protein [Flavobacteriales bacterium]
MQDTICLGTSVALSSSSSITLNTTISGFTYKGIHNGSYYFLSNSSEDWLKADLDCQSKGGHLAHIANVSENSFVMNSVINTSSWIGYYRNCNNGSYPSNTAFEWTDGTTGSFNSWAAGQPNNGTSNGEDHTVFYNSGVWHDYYYTNSFPYVLEIEETYLWNTGATTSTITESPTTTTTYWVDHSLGLLTTREYFNVVIGAEGCTDPSACNYDANAICDDGSCVLNLFVTAGSNQTICNGGISANLAANSSSIGTYSWSPAPAFVNPNLQNPIFNSAINTTTVYTVTFTDAASGCIANDDVTITVNPVPSVTLSALPNPACAGDNIVLTATPSIPVNRYRFQYNTGSGWVNMTSPGFQTTNPVTFLNISTTTQFRVKVREDNGCTNSSWSSIITVPINTIVTPPISHN